MEMLTAMLPAQPVLPTQTQMKRQANQHVFAMQDFSVNLSLPQPWRARRVRQILSSHLAQQTSRRGARLAQRTPTQMESSAGLQRVSASAILALAVTTALLAILELSKALHQTKHVALVLSTSFKRNRRRLSATRALMGAPPKRQAH